VILPFNYAKTKILKRPRPAAASKTTIYCALIVVPHCSGAKQNTVPHVPHCPGAGQKIWQLGWLKLIIRAHVFI